jgi:hypothetical protein
LKQSQAKEVASIIRLVEMLKTAKDAKRTQKKKRGENK